MIKKSTMENTRLPAGWEMKTLGDLSEVITKGTTPTSVGHKFVSEGINFIKVESISLSGNFISKKFGHITEEGHNTLKRSQLKNGDILFSIAGALGRTAIVNEAILPANTNQALAIIRLKEDSTFLNEYILSTLTSGYTIEQVENLKGGVAQQNLSLGQIKSFQIPLPPLPQQKQIVAILDKAFAAIDTAKTNAEQNLQNAKELFESYLQNVFENKGDDWEEKTLGDVLQKTETVNPKSTPNNEFVYLDVSSVNKETKLIEKTTTLLGKDAPSRARKLVKTNDIIFATVRPTHSRVAIITDEYNNQVCSTGYYVLRPKSIIENHYLFYFILTFSFNKLMESMQKGASYPAVNNKEVESVVINFPKSIKEQQKIVERLDSLSTETKKLEAIYTKKIADLEEMKKSVLQKAFSGQLNTIN